MPSGIQAHAIATALAGAIPIPLLGGYAQRLTRGAAFRRVARAHQTRLGGGARDVLARPWHEPAGLLRLVLRRIAAPIAMASRAEEAARLMVDARLFERYLEIAPDRGWRERGSAMSRSEAEQVRRALAASLRGSTRDAIKDVPTGVGRAWSELKADHEARDPLERLVDGLLDLASEFPAGALDAAGERFDRALESGRRDSRDPGGDLGEASEGT